MPICASSSSRAPPRPGAFESVWSRYAFDRRLRLLIFDAVERIEVCLKAQLAIYAGSWTDVSSLTFGAARRFFDAASTAAVKVPVAKVFGVHHVVLSSWLESLLLLRNVVARHGRVWNRQIGAQPKIPKKDAAWHTVRRFEHPVAERLISPDRDVCAKVPYGVRRARMVKCLEYLREKHEETLMRIANVQNLIVRRAFLGWALILFCGAMMTGLAGTDPGFDGRDLVPRPREVSPGTGFAAADAAISCVTGAVPEATGALTADESYRIDITPSVVRLTAPTERGLRYARTTLAQLRKLSGGRLPCGTIVDWPAFRYRGFMLDVGRNWQPLENIREILDFMAAYKLNLFHWHLTDYWGWRLESKAVPELNTDAATIRNVGKRYTQEEFLSVVDYAAARGITVLPEFDVPGHTEAFRRALGITTMRDPKADCALKAFFDEFVALVPPERMPYIHLGTDEVRNEPEKVDPSVVRTWAKHAAAKGHTIIGWAPGIDLAQDGIRSARMQWGSKDESAGLPFLDMTSRYIDVIDPLQILGMAAYAKPCPWQVPDGQALGALIGCWHDDLLTVPDQLFTNNAVFPAIVANADAFWCGRPKHRVASAVRLPQPDDPDLALAVDLERRVIAQRDRVLGPDFRRPFAFVAQTPMRWSLRYADGTLIAKDVPQATIILHQRGVAENLCPKTNATVVAETWIRSETDRTVGAWIGFTGLSRSSGRSIDSPLPDRGQWNRHGATVELNGERLAPPDWVNAGLRTTAEEMKVPHFWSFSALANRIPWTNEEYYMRPPTPIRLKKGWNHVRLTMPSPDPEPYACRHAWCMTFVPVIGTSAHPREVPGLEYRSEPPGSR